MTQGRTNRLSAPTATFVSGIVILPLIVAFAVDPAETSQTAPDGHQNAGGQPAILRGCVTNEAGAPLADVRMRVAIPATDMRFIDASTDHKQLETKSDAKGDYRLEISGITMPTTISIDAMKPGYRRFVGTLMTGGDAKNVEVGPGATADASLILKPALYFTGIVVDEHGGPISAVKIGANAAFGRSSGGVESTASKSDGSFELFNYPVQPFAREGGASKGYVFFFHTDYIDHIIEYVYVFASNEREALRIVLETGYKVTGTLFDVAGKPIPHAMVKAIRKDGSHGKATTTDANDRFSLHGLSKGLTLFTARALDIKRRFSCRWLS